MLLIKIQAKTYKPHICNTM